MAREEIIEMDGRDRSSTVGEAEEIYTGSETDIFGGHVETTDSGEGIGVIAEEMLIHPVSHTPKTDSGAGKTPTGTYIG